MDCNFSSTSFPQKVGKKQFKQVDKYYIPTVYINKKQKHYITYNSLATLDQKCSFSSWIFSGARFGKETSQ